MACKVITKGRWLAFRIYWNNRQIEQCTAWTDTARNRHKAERRADEISDEIRDRTFDYAKWFPTGHLIDEFRPARATPIKPKTVRGFYEGWIAKKVVPFVRKAQARDLRQHFNCYILGFLGDRRLDSLEVKDLVEFRTHLVTVIGVGMKTARNIIGGSLATMHGDALIEKVIDKNIFKELPRNWWPKLPRKNIDPFNNDEVDAILAYYLKHRPFWAYAYIQFRAFTGSRPSETSALKWGSVTLKTEKPGYGRAEIIESRYLETDDDTKTSASSRTITIAPQVVNSLEKILPLKMTPETYVFLDDDRKPVHQGEFGRKFQDVLRVLMIRPRRFYNLRHSYISRCLSAGEKPQWICEQVGTSLEMLQKNYGRYMSKDGGDLVEATFNQKPDQKPDISKKRAVRV